MVVGLCFSPTPRRLRRPSHPNLFLLGFPFIGFSLSASFLFEGIASLNGGICDMPAGGVLKLNREGRAEDRIKGAGQGTGRG